MPRSHLVGVYGVSQAGVECSAGLMYLSEASLRRSRFEDGGVGFDPVVRLGLVRGPGGRA